MLTLRQARGEDFSKLKVVIVGDVKHCSRVACSDLHMLRALGCGEIRVRPGGLLPDDDTLHGCVVSHDFDAALDGVDAGDDAAPAARAHGGRLVVRWRITTATTDQNAPAPRRVNAIIMHPGADEPRVEITGRRRRRPAIAGTQPVANGVAGADGGAGGAAGCRTATSPGRGRTKPITSVTVVRITRRPAPDR